MAVASPMRDLAAIVGLDNVLPGSTEPYGRDFTYDILACTGWPMLSSVPAMPGRWLRCWPGATTASCR